MNALPPTKKTVATAHSRGPRALALMTEAFGGRGGIAQFNRDFLRALNATDLMDAVEIIPRLGAAEVPVDMTTLRQYAPRLNRFAYAVSTVHRGLGQRFEIILNGHLYHGPLAKAVARACGAKLVSVLHGTEIWKPVSRRHLKPLIKSDLVLCVSADTRDRFLAQLDSPPRGRVEVLHNTFEDRFQPGDRAVARMRFGVGDEPVVLTVGRLDGRAGYKGHDRILPVIARLKREGSKVRYLIAGEGPDRPRLETLALEMGVDDRVTFLGYVPDDAMPDLYRAADLFALPSTGEGFGIVFLEAMACGTPAIGLDIGGARAALKDYGCVVPESAFAETLTILLAAPLERPEGLSEAVRTQFGREVFERRVANLIGFLTQ